MFKNIMEIVKTFHFDGVYPTWVSPRQNIVQPRVYRTMKGHGNYRWGNMYDGPTDNDLYRFGAQFGRFVFTTEPKGN